jgi:GntR family transcriptional regulator
LIIDHKSSTPLYEQVRLILQDRILLGEFSSGMLLPTEFQLCEQYGISRITVRNALEKLERFGLIERVQGRGSIVKKRDVKTSNMEVRGFTQSMQMKGLTPKSELLEKNLVIGNLELVELFNLPADGKHYFWHFRRLRYLNDEPVVIMNHYIRKELGDRMLDYDLGNVSFYTLFEKILNQQIHDSEGLITAIQAGPENSHLLRVNTGSALIWYRGTTHLEGNITVEVNYSLFLADKFQFETRMFKPRNINIQTEQTLIKVSDQ